jgi:hypothetical protein
MELRTKDETMTIIRQDGRSQIAKGEKIDYPNRTSRSGSAINLLPIFALLCNPDYSLPEHGIVDWFLGHIVQFFSDNIDPDCSKSK